MLGYLISLTEPQFPVDKKDDYNEILAGLFVPFERNHIKSLEPCLAEGRKPESHEIIPFLLDLVSF